MTKTIQLLLLLLVATISNQLSAQTTIVIDNSDAVFDGNWTTAFSSPDRYEKDYKFSSTTTGSDPTASATYTPDFKSAGRYNIYIWYPQGQNRATNAPWVISHEGGKETVTVNQQINGGQWVPIARDKPFKVGKEGYVKVVNNSGSMGSVVVADAVRFVPATAKDAATTASSSGSRPATSSGAAPKPATASSRNNFTLNIKASNGTVNKDPDELSYEPNKTVRLTARADEGFIFDGWSGDIGSNEKSYKNPITIKMDGNKNITCVFTAAGTGLVMDNEDDGVRYDGVWTLSTGKWQGKRYDSYRVVAARSKIEAKATYTPNIPRTGKYDVYVWHPAGKNRTTAAPWTVSSKNGVVTAYVNQQTASGEWILIASGVDMEAGRKPNQYAQLANNTPDFNERSVEGGRVVIADAVAFVYVGD